MLIKMRACARKNSLLQLGTFFNKVCLWCGKPQKPALPHYVRFLTPLVIVLLLSASARLTLGISQFMLFEI